MPRARDADLTGQRFGMLTAISKGRTDGKKRTWFYRCDCGRIKEKVRSEVTREQRTGRLSNCGCRTKEIQAQKRMTHGMTSHPAYWAWRSMNDRCRLPSHQAWKNYGARGISVCAEWQTSFEAFWKDMGASYCRGLELDRENNNGNYEKSNCRWVTDRTQSNNKRPNIYLDTPQGRMTVGQASRVFKIGVTTLLYRREHGWPPELMFADPDFSNRVGASMTFSMQDRAIDLSSEEVEGRL